MINCSSSFSEVKIECIFQNELSRSGETIARSFAQMSPSRSCVPSFSTCLFLFGRVKRASITDSEKKTAGGAGTDLKGANDLFCTCKIQSQENTENEKIKNDSNLNFTGIFERIGNVSDSDIANLNCPLSHNGEGIVCKSLREN